MQMMIIAHRGASKHAPENTMAAFQNAYEAGADAIETDVHLTKDIVPIIMHDEDVKRTTNGKGLIKDFTYEELSYLDAGSWFNNTFSSERIPTLEYFLKWACNKGIKVNIELKNNKIDYPYLETIVYEQLLMYNMLSNTILSTFNPKSIQRLQRYKNEVEIAYLTSNGNRLFERADELGVNSLHLKYKLLSEKLMQQAQYENKLVRIYTVNKTSQMIRVLRHNCAGLITDIPQKACKLKQIYHTFQ